MSDEKRGKMVKNDNKTLWKKNKRGKQVKSATEITQTKMVNKNGKTQIGRELNEKG